MTSVLRVALRLGIIENFAGELRVNSESLASWRNLEFRRKVEVLLHRFLEESAGERWSFHQEALRDILMDALRATEGDSWRSLDGLIDHCVGTYMLELEEREVASSLRLRREEDFAQKRLQSPFHRLGTDLAYWIVNRLLCLGMCEIGQIDGSLAAFRLTSLGHDQLGRCRFATGDVTWIGYKLVRRSFFPDCVLIVASRCENCSIRKKSNTWSWEEVRF